MSLNSFSFRRGSDPFQLSFDATPIKFDVPSDFFVTGAGKGATSFCIVNPTKYWVRLRGSGDGQTQTGSYVPVTATTGWLFPPGFWGVMSTQFPRYMSVMSVDKQGLGTGSGVIEISYGGGT
jgi:hypothetical protein